MFFTDPLIGKEIFNYEGVCGFNNTTSLANKKCQNLMTIYWLFVVGFGFLILSLITVYPFLKMNSKKKNLEFSHSPPLFNLLFLQFEII